MPVCGKWLEGSCGLGNKCPFVHGRVKTPLSKDCDEALSEERSRWGGRQPVVEDGNDASVQMRAWCNQLSQMQPGEVIEFPGLSPVERGCIHDIATSFHFEHTTCGVGRHGVLQIRRPLGPSPQMPIMDLEQCLSLPPADADEVGKMLKQVLAFHYLCKEHKGRKKAMDKEIETAAKQAFAILASCAPTRSGIAYHSMEDRDTIIKKLSNLKIQKVDLQGNSLGHKRASTLYDLAFVGDRDDDPVVVDVQHDEPAAATSDDTGSPSHAPENVPEQPPDVRREEEVHPALESTTIYVLQFKRRKRHLFREALEKSPDLRECSMAMKAAGWDSESEEHGFIFVCPHLYNEVCRKLFVMDVERHPYTIVVSEKYKLLLKKAFEEVPYRSRAKEDAFRQETFVINAPAATVALDTHVSMEAEMETNLVEGASEADSLPHGLKVTHTFICTVPLLADGASVNQSTTEAMTDSSEFHFSHARGVNPRRVIATM